MYELVPIPFYGTELNVIERDGEGYVAVRPVCFALGIDESSQRKRVLRHPVLAKGTVIMTVPSSGGTQQTFCIRLDLFAFWLATIQPTRVRPELQEALVRYQEECAQLLFTHFFSERNRVLGSAYVREWKACRRAFNRERYRTLPGN